MRVVKQALQALLLLSLSCSCLALDEWDADIREGIQLHKKYNHRRAMRVILESAKKVPQNQKEIAYWLMEEAHQLLQGEVRDEVGARGLLDSAMSVALLVMDAETIYTVANVFLLAGGLQQALDGYKQVQKLYPQLASAYHQIGLTLSRMNRLEEAFEAYNGAIELLPSYAITYNNIGVLLSKMGRVEEALAHYEAAFSIDDNYADAKNNIAAAKLQLEAKEREAAVKKLDSGLFDLPAEDATDEKVTTALRKLIQDAEARRKRAPTGVLDEDLKVALSNALPIVRKSSDPHALFALGTVLYELGAFWEAASTYERVAEILPKSASPQHQRGLSLAKAGEFNEALQAYQLAVSNDGNMAISYNNMGVLLSKMAKHDEALHYYQIAHSIDPEYKDAVDNIAAIHRTLNHWKELVQHHKEVLHGAEGLTSDQIPIVLAGYKTAGDGLGSHLPEISRYMSRYRNVVELDTDNMYDVEANLDDNLVLVVVEPYRLVVPRGRREYRIYLTLFESDRIPPSWVEILNQHASEVWTTLPWLRDGFRASGVHVPIKIFPIGTSPPSLPSAWHERPPAKNGFVFLLIANMQPRKGVVETAESFIAAFGANNSQVTLRIHAKWGDTNVFTSLDSFKQYSNIISSTGTLEAGELADLWLSADCVIALSKGEGWGQIPREALSLGIPVIMSDIPCWQDIKELAHKEGYQHAYFVRTAGTQPAIYAFTAESTGSFLIIDEVNAQETMVQVYRRYSSLPSRPSGAKLGQGKFPISWESASEKFLKEMHKDVLVFTKSLGVACGISSYTYDLFGDLPGAAFARSWSEVFVYAKFFKLKALHIQHEHGLHWDDNEFLRMIYEFANDYPDITIFVTMHSLYLGYEDRTTFYKSLSTMAYIITLNGKAAQHATFELMHIEHGIPSSYQIPPTPILRQNHVATFGFWDPEKRHDALCQLAEDAQVAIDLYSHAPAEFGEMSCDGLVNYYRDFLDTPDLLMRLSEYSAIVFLRRPSHLSFAASGSARMALLANVPVICEDSLHFADLENTVELAPLEEIPRRIREVVSNEELRRHIVERQKQFVAKWPPSEIQARHRALYDQLRPKHMPGELPPDYIEKAAMPAEESDEANKLRDEMNKFVDSPIRNLADEEEEDSEFAKFRSEKIREHLRRSNLRGDKRIKDAA